MACLQHNEASVGTAERAGDVWEDYTGFWLLVGFLVSSSPGLYWAVMSRMAFLLTCLALGPG